MSEYVSYKCDVCGVRIEEHASPIVVKEVIGVAPSVGTLDVTAFPLPQRVRDVLANPKQNVHRCIDCRAWEYGEDLVDAAGIAVVRHQDHTSRDSFVAAARAKR